MIDEINKYKKIVRTLKLKTITFINQDEDLTSISGKGYEEHIRSGKFEGWDHMIHELTELEKEIKELEIEKNEQKKSISNKFEIIFEDGLDYDIATLHYLEDMNFKVISENLQKSYETIIKRKPKIIEKITTKYNKIPLNTNDYSCQ